ncbi:MAG: class I SAM-dependent methyltransferase [Thermoplasmata archaeon]|nr:class I SAM-dependent methyltransferase [Thermoplasmata archaeon]
MATRPVRRTSARSLVGLSAQARARWRTMYAQTPYQKLPWFDPGPSRSTRLAVSTGFLPMGGSILDIGCGAGSNVIFLAKHGFVAHGIDISPGAVAAARERASKARVRVDVREGDALALPFADGSLDGAIDHGCFHTLPIRRRAEYATEVRRVLRRDGRFVLTWVAREHTGARGPPHRPSVEEVARALEPKFLFTRTAFQAEREGGGPACYLAFLLRRSTPQPPRM